MSYSLMWNIDRMARIEQKTVKLIVDRNNRLEN